MILWSGVSYAGDTTASRIAIYLDAVHGNDSNTGTAEGTPLQHLEAARNLARRLAPGYKGVISVNLKGGTYFLAKTLVLTRQDGGSTTRYEQRAGYIQNACNTLFWNPETNEFYEWMRDDVRGGSCPSSILIAGLYFDMYDQGLTKKFMSRLMAPQRQNLKYERYRLAFGYYYLFFHVLFTNICHDFALGLMKAYFGKWVELGGTTFGKVFDLEETHDWKTLETEYNTHGYAAAAHEHFYTGILGIQPHRKGFARINISPQPGSLGWAKGSLYTPGGMVHVSWTLAGGMLDCQVTGPPTYAYNFSAPLGPVSSLCRVNGKPAE